jgi:hypothetical protein
MTIWVSSMQGKKIRLKLQKSGQVVPATSAA